MKRIIVMALLVAVMLLGCGFEVDQIQSGDNWSRIDVYTDSDTGVQYLIYRDGYRGGICPRYDADGTLVVSE